MYMTLPGSASADLSFASRAMPTIVIHGAGLSAGPRFMRLPIGSSFGKSWRAAVSRDHDVDRHPEAVSVAHALAANDLRLHRREVRLRHRVRRDARHLTRIGDGMAFYRDHALEGIVAEWNPIRRGDALDARQRRDALEYFLKEQKPRRRRDVLAQASVIWQRDRHLGGEQMVGCESEVHLLQLPETPDDEPCAGEQHDGHRQLEDDEHTARSTPSGARRRGAATRAENIGERRSRADQCREHADEQSREHGADDDEREHAPIDGDVVTPRKARRRKRSNRADARRRQHRADHAAGQREQRVFDEQRANQPAASSANRGANGGLRASCGAARQQQTRDVRARDEQHEAHRAEQQVQRPSAVAHHHFAQRTHDDLPAAAGGAVVGGIRREQLGVDPVEVALHIDCRHAGFRARDDVARSPATLRSRGPRRATKAGGKPHLDRSARLVDWMLEVARHHADDRVVVVVESHLASDRARPLRRTRVATRRS